MTCISFGQMNTGHGGDHMVVDTRSITSKPVVTIAMRQSPDPALAIGQEANHRKSQSGNLILS